QEVVALTQELSSGRHKMFVQSLVGEDGGDREKAFVLRASKDKVLRTIKRVRGSLGYGIVSLEEAQAEGVTVMAIDGKPPSTSNIQSGLYPLTRPQLLISIASSHGTVQRRMVGFEKFARPDLQPEDH